MDVGPVPNRDHEPTSGPTEVPHQSLRQGLHQGDGVYSRRAALGLGAAALAGAAIGTEAAAAATTTTRTAAEAGTATQDGPSLLDALKPEINGRNAWGADLAVAAPILPEDDVRFLLVHHTASANEYGPDQVADEIRGFHRFHTGPEKGWADVAYNFFIDRFGGIWEARQGSIDGAVRGDATGGSQGFALLCSLIGDHSQVPVSTEARSSLVALLAWLAERHQIDTEPGATIEFVSRGSNRWPVGSEVTTATISGHRDMSQTSCPGDFAYDLLAIDLPRAVTDRRLQVADAVNPTPTAPPPTLVAPQTTATAPSTTGVEPASPSGASDATGDDTLAAGEDTDPSGGGAIDVDDVVVPAVAAGAAAITVGALAAIRRRRGADDPSA